MLSRPATKISLTMDDIVAFEQRKQARDAARVEQMDSSQDTSHSTVDDAATHEEVTPAQQTRVARAKASRDARIGLGGPSRS
jgi:hypothetical protein